MKLFEIVLGSPPGTCWIWASGCLGAGPASDSHIVSKGQNADWVSALSAAGAHLGASLLFT